MYAQCVHMWRTGVKRAKSEGFEVKTKPLEPYGILFIIKIINLFVAEGQRNYF